MPLSSEDIEKRIREALAREEVLTASFETLYRQLLLLEAAINERSLTLTTLENLKKVGENDFLIPLGGVAFIPGKLATDFVLTAIGAGYYIKCGIEEAIKFVEGNLEELGALRKATAERLDAVTKELNKVRNDIRNLMEVMKALQVK